VSPTIGVFDSGFGGLTVLRELLRIIPGAHYVYLGDTARLPYGSKSRETVVRYALSSARFLEEHGAELLVTACNTATALALEDLQEALPIPVIGVVDPGTRAATRACGDAGNGERPGVLVLATQATVDSHAYARSCEAAGLLATEKACPLLVPLILVAAVTAYLIVFDKADLEGEPTDVPEPLPAAAPRRSAPAARARARCTGCA